MIALLPSSLAARFFAALFVTWLACVIVLVIYAAWIAWSHHRAGRDIDKERQ